jgi:hypothetical protein
MQKTLAPNDMRYYLVLLISLISFDIIGQTTNCEFKVYDSNDSVVDYLTLVIDDTVYVQPYLDNKQKTELKNGYHKIKCELYGYKLIDTTLMIIPNNYIIKLKADITNDALLFEFNKGGFIKIYTNKDNLPIIGLKDDKTFMMKSFFHMSIVGCFQLEKGKYKILNDTLILNVNAYECPCFRTMQRIEHTYKFAIKDDTIVDLEKYSGFIEKRYALGLDGLEKINARPPNI